MIKLGDIKINQTQRKYISEILDNNTLTEGKFVQLFEKETAKFLKVKHVIAVSNGTVALELVAHYIKRYLGKDNPTVCVPALTFPATLNAFLNAGYTPILCDVDKTMTINIENLTTDQCSKIDVIVPVSLLGYPPNMDKIKKRATDNNWIVVEDFAEAFGTKYKDKRLGSIGDFGCSSFYISHVLQAGEMGIVTTNNDIANEILRSMKNHGRFGNNLEFNHKYIGSNYKTTEFCASICYEQMQRADDIINNRLNNALRIFTEVSNKKLSLGQIYQNISFLGYPIFCKTEQDKNEMIDYLSKQGIESRSMFPCLANQESFKSYNFGKYPMAEHFEKTGFYIGIHQYLTTGELQHIISSLNMFKI